MRSVVFRLLPALAAGGLLIGCSSKPTGPGEKAAITLAVSPASVTVTPGSQTTATATVSGNAAFSGVPTVTVEGSPSGVTASYSLSGSGLSTVVTVTIKAAASTAPGNYPLTLRASANNVEPVTAAVTLIITPPPSLSLRISPAAATVVQGGSSTHSIGFTRSYLSGSITLSVSGAPAGLTSSFEPTGLISGDAATLTFGTGTAVALGTYEITVRAAAAGVPEASAVVTLTVVPAPSFSMTVEPAAATLIPGGSSTHVLSLTRSNLSTGITFSATGLPAGFDLTFSPATTTGNTTSLTLTASGAVTAGNYSVTIRGSAAGASDQTVTLLVTVPQLANINFASCGPDDRPIWLAVQDGSGAWTRVVGQGDLYRVGLTQPKAGLAWVVRGQRWYGDLGYGMIIKYLSRSEILAGSFSLCGPPAVPTTLMSMSYTGGENSVTTTLSFGSHGTSYGYGSAGGMTQRGEVGKAFDLVARNAGRAFLKRDVMPGGSPLGFGTFDFASPANGRFDLPTAAFMIANGGSGSWFEMTASLVGGAGARDCSRLNYDWYSTTSSSYASHYMPPEKLRSGELHNVLFLEEGDWSGGRAWRSASESFSNPAVRLNQPFYLPPEATTPLITPHLGSSEPYFRLSLSGSAIPEVYNADVELIWDDFGELDDFVIRTAAVNGRSALSRNQPNGTAEAAFGGQMTASRAWRNGSGIEMTVPDFSGLEGWDAAWPQPRSDRMTHYYRWSYTGNNGKTLCQDGYQAVSLKGYGSSLSSRF